MAGARQLRLRDLRQLYRVVLECCRLGRQSRGWRHFLFCEIRRLTQAQVAMGGEALLLARPRLRMVPEPTRGVIDMGWPHDEGRLRFLEFLRRQDTLRDESCLAVDQRMLPLLVRAGRVVTRRRIDLLDDHTWYESFSFTQYRQPCGIDDHILSVGRIDGRMIHVIALHRELGAPPFAPRDVRLVHWLHYELLPLMGKTLRRGVRAVDQHPELAPRLREVLECLLAGDSEKQIARRLGITAATVHEHVKRLHRYFAVSSRAELLAQFIPPASPHAIDDTATADDGQANPIM